jgi:DNA processing protein
MDEKNKKLNKKEWPLGLFEIPQKPKRLFCRGKFPDKDVHKFLCVVGSRKHSNYAEQAIQKLIGGLKGRNIIIVSGLAIGIDTLAHEAALETGLKTIAVLGAGVAKDSVYPTMNRNLAERIIEDGGCLISEVERGEAQVWTFPSRNRIMAGMSGAILVIEAGEKSGTLITARMALDYNKELLVVPTTIFSSDGQGSNRLLREGARPVFNSDDILDALGLDTSVTPAKAGVQALNSKERTILQMISKGICNFDEMLLECKFGSAELTQTLMEMEIKGLLIKSLGKYEALI